MIPSISWKNIWRNRVRSLVVIVALTVGLFGGLFCAAFFNGMGDRRVSEALATETTHIQIHHPKYLENPEIQFYIPESDKILEFIDQQPDVATTAFRTKITSMIASSSANSGVTVLGVDPEQEKKVSRMYETLLTEEEVREDWEITDPEALEKFMKDSVGAYFEGVSRNPILVGEELAEKLKIKVRSKLVLTFQDASGNLTGASFRVCGIFRLENSTFEENMVFVRSDDLTSLLGMSVDQPHEIAIRMANEESTAAVTEAIREAFPDMETNEWRELLPDIAMLNDMMTVSMLIIIIIILLALGFGIVNTMLMVVMERVKELGMLMAVGMNKLRVFTMIILESVLLCLTGGVFGIIISVAIIELTKTHGIDLTFMFKEGFEAMGFSAVFYPSLGFNFYVLVTLLVVLTGVLASIYPAWKALKLNPSDALRTE